MADVIRLRQGDNGGDFFHLEPYDFDNMTGLIEGDWPVMFLFNGQTHGLCMTPDAARALGVSLIECAALAENEEPPEAAG